MKQLLTFPIFLLIVIVRVVGQTPVEENFNRAFLQIYMHTASEDVNQALKSADSLYRTAVNTEHKIRSLMLISDMYHRLANRDSSIHYAVVAERIADRTNNYVWQARICGVLSTQHRETGLLQEGKRYLEKGLKVIERVEHPEMVNQFKGQCYQELGFYALEEQQYREAIDHFKRAAPFFVDLKDSVVRYTALAQNEERLGISYLKLEIIDSAKAHYEHAMMLERNASNADTPIKGFIYNGLGRIYLKEDQFRRADSCLQRALAIAESSGIPNLKISVYESLAQYNRLAGTDEAYRYYNEKYLEGLQGRVINNRRYADNIISHVRQRVIEMAESNRVLGLAASAFVVIVGLGMGTYIRKQRKNQRRYKDVIRKLRSERVHALTGRPVIAEALPDRDKDLMPESTKQELLKKLERFESSQQFTDRNISIAVLAGRMKTNTKYLSYIINNYRNKDFNGYINELRIHYIVAKMETDSRYLNYKISYLAEECGFATHSQFTTVFRNITGLSPSTFMTYLRKDGDIAHQEVLNR